MDLRESNDYMLKLLEKGAPFIVSRLGIGSETFLTHEYLETGNISQRFLGDTEPSVSVNAGIYASDIEKFKEFARKYAEAIQHSTALACFADNPITKFQDYFMVKYSVRSASHKVLEPFYCCMEDIVPWTLSLKGKRVLIVNPFVESMKKQLASKFQIFKDKKIFDDAQEFVFYKSYQTTAGNHIHKDWTETFALMCKDIADLDFDIALLGCGGYGLPLCDFIKTKLGRSAVYVGGGLQLLFGVMGKRWESTPVWKKIIAENEPKFIRPSGDEICPNKNRIERGCYW